MISWRYSPRREHAKWLHKNIFVVEFDKLYCLDEWAAYNRIPLIDDGQGNRMNYQHFTVNHSENYVNPVDPNINTQLIENSWKQCKRILMDRDIGTYDALLQSHLDHFWWNSLHGTNRCDDPFLRLVGLINERYPQN
ncbi:MAG: transposase [Gammaproteobacteria bacterium]|nr:transposase [Gammaproteobacteria bacterium]